MGDGPLRPYLERLRDQQGLTENIIFIGAKGDDQLPHFYNAADLYILPVTYGEKEFTLLEALACGKPVVYTKRIKMQIEDERVYNVKCTLDSRLLLRIIIKILRAAWCTYCRTIRREKH